MDEREEPSFDELLKVLREKEEEKTRALEKEGYRMRVPRGEWSNACQSLVLTLEDGVQKIPEGRLVRIIDGFESVSDEEKKAIDGWYAISRYRIGHEYAKMEKEMEEARKLDLLDRVFELREKMDRLEEEGSMDHVETTKRRLAYEYGESGERLDRLYERLYSERMGKNVRFGLMMVNISNTKKELENRGYAESRGFFEDFENAFRAVRDFKGDLEFSESMGVAYTTEYVLVEGDGDIKIGDEKVRLEGFIMKDGLKNEMDARVSAETDLDVDEVYNKLEFNFPEYAVDRQDDSLRGDNDKIRLAYHNHILLFRGRPNLLRDEVPRILEVIK
jgi:hypothetical protein